jgi:hypothetical protein
VKLKGIPGYLEFIRRQPCRNCGRRGGEAHHEPLWMNAVGAKPPDTQALPLCPECHQLRHNQGALTFWGDMYDRLALHMVRYLTRFLCGERY